MIAAAHADLLGAMHETKEGCVYRRTNPGDGRDVCFCSIGAQLPPDVLDRIEAADANWSTGIYGVQARIGVDIFDLIGLTASEASEFQDLHDGIFREVAAGLPRAEANNLFVEQLKSFVNGVQAPGRYRHPFDIVDFSRA